MDTYPHTHTNMHTYTRLNTDASSISEKIVYILVHFQFPAQYRRWLKAKYRVSPWCEIRRLASTAKVACAVQHFRIAAKQKQEKIHRLKLYSIYTQGTACQNLKWKPPPSLQNQSYLRGTVLLLLSSKHSAAYLHTHRVTTTTKT